MANTGLLTILVAEDNPDDYLMLEYAFKKADFAAKHLRVNDGVEAKAYLLGEDPYGDRTRTPLPALVVADLKMPRMNGIELLRWAREQPIIKRIPFIVLSASANSRDVTAAYESFANCYHVKPSRVEDLVALVRQMSAYWFKVTARPEISISFG